MCIALYGFIAVSGLKMIQKVDLNENNNLFVVSTILVTGVGGMALSFGQITITAIATALILGILVNLLVNIGSKKKGTMSAADSADTTSEASEKVLEKSVEAAAADAAPMTEEKESAGEDKE